MTARMLAISWAMIAVLAFAAVGQAQEEKGTSLAPKASKAKTKTKGQAQSDTAKPEGKDATSPGETEKKPVKLEKATFGGGCFWCLEAVFERYAGVKNVVSGYAGGNVPRPTYDMVCTGLTGHAEVVQIVYDPEVITYDKLLDIFWACHDPTSLNRQGEDEGTQYRSIILYHNNDQKQAALKSYKTLTAANAYPNPIVTELVPLKVFYPAERYHQNYFRKHPDAPYCQMVIAPKLQKLHMKEK
jgi:peptide-methionine (S)-S-oxide reductase